MQHIYIDTFVGTLILIRFQNTYFTDDLPQNCFIFLSEKDKIVETKSVVDYLCTRLDSTRKVVMFKSFPHGQILASPEVSEVVAAINTLSKT